MRFLHSLLLMFLVSAPFFAEGKISITSGWDVKTGTHDGRKCLLSPFNITVEDMDGKDCEVHLYLADAKGKITNFKGWKKNERGESYYPLTLHVVGNHAVFSYKDCNFPLLYFDDIILSDGQEYKDINDGFIVLTEKGELPDIAMGFIESTEEEEKYPTPAEVFLPQSGNKPASSKQANKEQPLYENTYYYTGAMDSGSGLVQACDAGPAQKVKIYSDRILFGNLLYRLNGSYLFDGSYYPKYEAVDANGRNMPNKFLLRNGTELAEILVLNIMGFQTKTLSLINEGYPPVKTNVSPGYTPSTPSTASPSTQPAPRQPKRCGLCNGTGHFGKQYAAQYSYSQKVRCNECGDWDYPHFHPDCPSCKGKGYY